MITDGKSYFGPDPEKENHPIRWSDSLDAIKVFAELPSMITNMSTDHDKLYVTCANGKAYQVFEDGSYAEDEEVPYEG